jgi:hypothetical protein
MDKSVSFAEEKKKQLLLLDTSIDIDIFEEEESKDELVFHATYETNNVDSPQKQLDKVRIRPKP